MNLISRGAFLLGILLIIISAGYLLFLHIVVTQIAYYEHGFLAALITFSVPVLSWLLWAVLLIGEQGLWNSVIMLFCNAMLFNIPGNILIRLADKNSENPQVQPL